MTGHAADDSRAEFAPDFAELERADPSDGPWGRRLPAVLFAGIALLIALDLVLDGAEGADLGHLGFEAVVFVLAAGGLGALWAQIVRARRRTRALESNLVRARDDALHWRRESEAVLRGLGEAIDRQFEKWGLSLAEREVGVLLLKGLSLKEIAVARGTSERTTRQQALAVYRKAEVAGRAELSAYFLEDLLLPSSAAAAAGK